MVAQVFEALRYETSGSGFDSRWCNLNFLSTQTYRPHYGPGINSASNRKEYQEYFLGGKGGRCLGLTTLPPSCADCLEIWEPQHPGAPRSCPSLLQELLYLYLYLYLYLDLYPPEKYGMVAEIKQRYISTFFPDHS